MRLRCSLRYRRIASARSRAPGTFSSTQRIFRLEKYVESGNTLPEFNVVLTSEAMARQLADEDLWQSLLDASKMEAATNFLNSS